MNLKILLLFCIVIFSISVYAQEIKALYLNAYTCRPDTIQFKRALNIIETTPINALIIDMKNVKGNLSYKSSLEEVKLTSASKYSHILNLKQYVANLKSKGVYLIARVAVFKDKKEASAFPSRAIHTQKGSSVWRDRHNEKWVDPFNEKAQEYALSIAKEIAEAGFDEINFDYIRFPAHKRLVYSKANTEKNRVSAIDSFLEKARSELHPLGVKISADIFGYVLWSKTDTHIGQILEDMAQRVDYLSPMLYPSGFSRGSVKFKNPTLHPYSIVKISLQKGLKRGVPADKFRPWLQSFRDYAYSRHSYKEHEIGAQIRACMDLNTSGWLLWNPSSRYRYITSKLFSMIYSEDIKNPSKILSYRYNYSKNIKREYTTGNFKNKSEKRRNPLDILR